MRRLRADAGLEKRQHLPVRRPEEYTDAKISAAGNSSEERGRHTGRCGTGIRGEK